MKFAFSALAVTTSLSVFLLLSNISKNNIKSETRTPSSISNSAKSDAEQLFLKELKGDESGLSRTEIYNKMVKSTVGIVRYDTAADIIAKEAAEGSGVIVSKDGYIVTNSHVIGDTKDANIKVIIDGEELRGDIIGFDERTDLAVVKVDRDDLTPAEFGDSDQLPVGASVLALGNPGGMDFSDSLSSGIVSAVNRSLGNSNLVTYIQTDAAINPGNSGGALIDMFGRVVGITTAKITAQGFEGMGFSIPSKIVKSVIDDIIKQGYVSARSQIGITAKDISEYVSQVYNVPQGILVTDVIKGSDACSKDIQSGDIITQFNGNAVSSTKALMNEIAAHKPGDTVTLTIQRNPSYRSFSNQPLNFEVTVTLTEDTGEGQDSKREDLGSKL